MVKNKIVIGGQEVFLVKRKMKSIKIAVKENGDVVVSFPSGVPMKTVCGFVESKKDWIEKMQAQLKTANKKDLGNGARVWVLGKEYVVKRIVGEKNKAKILGEEIVFWVVNENDESTIKKLFWGICKKELKKVLPKYFEKWGKTTGLEVKGFSVRDMATRWGSCNPKKQTISINVRVAEKPLVCLDYLVLHEMAHIVEPSHNQNFKNFLSRYMPSWKIYRKMLKK